MFAGFMFCQKRADKLNKEDIKFVANGEHSCTEENTFLKQPSVFSSRNSNSLTLFKLNCTAVCVKTNITSRNNNKNHLPP